MKLRITFLGSLLVFVMAHSSSEGAVLARYLDGDVTSGIVGETSGYELEHASGVNASNLKAKDSGILPYNNKFNSVAFQDAGNGNYWAYFNSINFTNQVNPSTGQYPSTSTNGRTWFSAAAAADTQLVFSSLSFDLASVVSDTGFTSNDINVLYKLFYKVDGAGPFIEHTASAGETGFVAGAHGFKDLGTISFDISDIAPVTGSIEFVISLGLLDQQNRTSRGARTIALSNIVLEGEALSTIPEPSAVTFSLAALGLAGLRRRRKSGV